MPVTSNQARQPSVRDQPDHAQIGQLFFRQSRKRKIHDQHDTEPTGQ